MLLNTSNTMGDNKYQTALALSAISIQATAKCHVECLPVISHTKATGIPTPKTIVAVKRA